MAVTQTVDRPRVLLFVDKPQWALATIAHAIQLHLGDRFCFDILARDDRPVIDESRYDIVHTLFEYDTYQRQYLHGKAKIVRSVYSHYWQMDGLSASDLYATYLREAHAITVPSIKLLEALQEIPSPVYLVEEGVDTHIFHPQYRRTGTLKVGWAGDITRTIKRLPWIEEACKGLCEFHVADGHLTEKEMVDFYNTVDVVACASKAEACPRPLLEGMACGAFPVSFDVGIAREVIDHAVNGLLVKDQSIQGLRSAFTWCLEHLEDIRKSGPLNTARIQGKRTWASVLQPLAEVYYSVL